MGVVVLAPSGTLSLLGLPSCHNPGSRFLQSNSFGVSPRVSPRVCRVWTVPPTPRQ